MKMAILCQEKSAEKSATIYGCVESISGSEAREISGWLFRVAPDIVFQGFGKAGQAFLRVVRTDRSLSPHFDVCLYDWI